MVKKKGKNLQKLLKNKQLQQLQSGAVVPSSALEQPEELPKIMTRPDQPKLPSGERPLIIRTLISTTVIIVLLIGVSVSATSQDYLSRFGDWLYQSLELSD